MTDGTRVWDGSGNLIMDTNSFSYQVIWQGVIDFSGTTGTYTFNIPGFNPANCVFMIIPTRAQDVQSSETDGNGNAKSYPYVSVSVGQVVVRFRNPAATGTMTGSRIVAKGYAIRYSV